MPAEVKLFEVRDDGTCMPVIGIRPDREPLRIDEEALANRWIWARSGYGTTQEMQHEYVLVGTLAGGDGILTCDPMKHPGGSRTMPTAHTYIRDHWHDLQSGAVIDVEYILNESLAPKQSEREEILQRQYGSRL